MNYVRNTPLAVLPVLITLGCAGLGGLPERTDAEKNAIPREDRELPVPTGVGARSGVSRAVPVTWDPAHGGDVAGYGIERAEAREGPFEEIARLSGRGQLLYLDRGGAQGLPDDTTHFYRVRALDVEGIPARKTSEVVVATTAPPPPAPQGLRAYSQHPRQIPLAWQASQDARIQGYVVERSPTPVGPFQRIAETHSPQETAYVDSDLGDLAVFYYRVASRNRDGTLGAPGPSVRAITKAEPLPPLGLRVVSQRLGEIGLQWQPNVETDLSAYRLIRTREGDAPETVARVPAGVTHTIDSGLSSGDVVRYQAIAVDRDGLESQPSSPLSATGLGYEFRVQETPKGIYLKWKPRWEEGYTHARILRQRGLFERRETRLRGDRFLDEEVEAGNRYRYVVTLEFPDGSLGPPSRPVEIFVGAASAPR